MAHFSRNMNNQFQRLGFDNYQEMKKNAVLAGEYQILTHEEKIALPRGTGDEMLAFTFVLGYNASLDIDYIESIELLFKKPIHGAVPPAAIIMSENMFARANGPLPTKVKMIQHILATRAKDEKLRNKAILDRLSGKDPAPLKKSRKRI